MGRKPTGRSPWTTADEVEYLRKLGLHRPKDKVGPEDKRRPDLLREYLRTIDLRYEWGAVEKRAVKQAAEMMLE